VVRVDGRPPPPTDPSRYFFFFLAAFFFFAIRKSPPFRCDRRLSPRLAALVASGSSAASRLERPLSPRLRASPFSSNCHAGGILSALASAEPRLELRAPSRLERRTLDVGYRRRPFFVAFLRFFALFFLAFFFIEASPPFPA